ncbi:MAG: signal recognition particle protein [Candidatus Eisenbacteria bacterium]|nr:signal recognition particle protein [Candidatus Eisenbacteria bacterium]
MFEELTGKLEKIFSKLRNRGKLTPENIRESIREIRRALLEADVNYKVAKELCTRVEEKAIGQEVLKSLTPGQVVVKIVHDELTSILGGSHASLGLSQRLPTTVMAVGLQGSGKTTFVAKLGLKLKKKGKRVLLLPTDTRRPAAIEQLKVLGESASLDVFLPRESETPLEIWQRGIADARQRGFDFLLVDTGGRLHIDDELMEELSAMRRLLFPHEILLVLDGMTGQDALTVSETFLSKLGFDGIVLTKMDGDSRGGAALSARYVTGKPIKFLSVGEKLDSLDEFYPERMASRILGMGDVVSLVEKVTKDVEEEKARELEEKLRKHKFDLEDFLFQLKEVKKMGPLDELLKLIPGVAGKMQGIKFDEKALSRVEAIVSSMTPRERKHPEIIDGSRRKRISGGSGTTVQDVNRLLKQFEDMKKMILRMGKVGKFGKIPFPL